jgi:hypothetical protein
MNLPKKKIIKVKLEILDQIESIRRKNNTKWMDLCRLAITLDHKKSSKIISDINKYDTKINILVKKLTK